VLTLLLSYPVTSANSRMQEDLHGLARPDQSALGLCREGHSSADVVGIDTGRVCRSTSGVGQKRRVLPADMQGYMEVFEGSTPSHRERLRKPLRRPVAPAK
jgi:hypothetical protein